MFIPIRCFTCNAIIANKWKKFKNGKDAGKSENQIFIELGLTKYCCKRMFLGHVDIIDDILLYDEINDSNIEKK